MSDKRKVPNLQSGKVASSKSGNGTSSSLSARSARSKPKATKHKGLPEKKKGEVVSTIQEDVAWSAEELPGEAIEQSFEKTVPMEVETAQSAATEDVAPAESPTAGAASAASAASAATPLAILADNASVADASLPLKPELPRMPTKPGLPRMPTKPQLKLVSGAETEAAEASHAAEKLVEEPEAPSAGPAAALSANPSLPSAPAIDSTLIDTDVQPAAKPSALAAVTEAEKGPSFRNGERAFMLNPYYRDGTRLRVAPEASAAFNEQFVLNDYEVEVLDVTRTGGGGENDGAPEEWALIRSCGDEATKDTAVQGWVRAVNLTRIRRAVGLPGLEQIAQMACDALAAREKEVLELEAQLSRREDEIATLKSKLAAAVAEAAENAKMVQEASSSSSSSSSSSAAAAAVAAVDADAANAAPAISTPARVPAGAPWQVDLRVGDRMHMNNPFFSDGTRLRIGPSADAEFFSPTRFILNDEEVEIVAVDATGEFVEVKSTQLPSAESAESETGQPPVQGWVRARNVTKHKRESGLAGLKRQISEQLIQEAAKVVPSAPPSAEPSAGAEGASMSQSDASAYAAAHAAMAAAERAAHVASHLKHALEKANLRLMVLFRDWDADGSGAIDRSELSHALESLGLTMNKAEVDAIFDIWDTDGSGGIEFKELEYALKSGARRMALSQGSIAKRQSAKDIQKALREKLQGPRRGAVGFKGAGADKQVAAGGAARGGTAGGGLVRSRTKGKSSAALTGVDGGAAQEGEASEAEEEEGEEAEGVWTALKWLSALEIPKVVRAALKLPRRSQQSAFDYVRSLRRETIEQLLRDAELGGLVAVLVEGAGRLRAQRASSSVQLNDKFASSAKFQMSYGSLSLFYGGLESLIGPPVMVKDPERVDAATGEMEATLYKAMANEHTDVENLKDVDITFHTTNGMATTSMLEWEIVTSPSKNRESEYPERTGLREQSPEFCRRFVPLKELKERMEADTNRRLIQAEHAPMIEEELIAGRLYTGPMYMKYNLVLRAQSKDPYLVEQFNQVCRGNKYATSIHAINSCVLKLSKLTKACKVYRGVKDAMLPKEFWVPNDMGVRGGIEYGFSSTTTDKSQALEYATGGMGADSADGEGTAMVIFEMQMGMVDRGAELSWLSQYPHEREVLLPPLTGVEALSSDVEGQLLVIQSRLSLNLAAQTLEQVRRAPTPIWCRASSVSPAAVLLAHSLPSLRSGRCSRAATRCSWTWPTASSSSFVTCSRATRRPSGSHSTSFERRWTTFIATTRSSGSTTTTTSRE